MRAVLDASGSRRSTARRSPTAASPPTTSKRRQAAFAKPGTSRRQFNLIAMIEFARTSTHLSTLRSTLTVIREAAHSNVRPMLDFFHFWSGMSKFEDLDMIRPGEIAHVHFQDILDTPRELMDNNGRVIPGDGAAPVVAILRKLAEKQYSGPLSVELFLMELQQGDPFEVGQPDQTEVRSRDAEGGCALERDRDWIRDPGSIGYRPAGRRS